MRILKHALLPAAVAILSLAGASANAAAERHYDCTKAGNANKAECKAAAAKPAAMPAPAAPVAAAKSAPAPAPMAAAKPAKRAKAAKGEPGARSPAQLANDNKMKACGAKWDGLGAGDKAKWNATGASRKDKNGKPESGWIAYSVDCRKSA